MTTEITRISRQKVNKFFFETKKSSSKDPCLISELPERAEQLRSMNGKIINFNKLRLPHRQTKKSIVNHTVGHIYHTERTDQKERGQWVSSSIQQDNLFKGRFKITSRQKHFQDKANNSSCVGISNSKDLIKNNQNQKINSATHTSRIKTQQYTKNDNNYSFNLSPKYSAYQKVARVMPREPQNSLMSNQIENLREQIIKTSVLLQQIKSLKKQNKKSVETAIFKTSKIANRPNRSYLQINPQHEKQQTIDSTFLLSPFKTFIKKNSKNEKQQTNENRQSSFQQKNRLKSAFSIFGEQNSTNEQIIKTPKGRRQNYFVDNKKYPGRQKTRSKSNEQQVQIPSPFFRKPSRACKELEKNQTPLKITKKDFTYIKKIGQGKFGSVFVVFHRKTNSIFAIKQIPKDKIKTAQMVNQFITEVKIQTFLDHPNIVKIFGIFDDAKKVYLILQYCEQGNIFNSLKGVTSFSQKLAKKYVSQIAVGIKHLQDNQIFHRDLKPENIVLTYNTCKICDFGCAAISQDRRNTYCGTFDYVAPQLFQQTDYDKSVDLWALGILTYEMLFGKVPFYHQSRKQTIKRILNVQNKKLEFPLKVSNDAKSFIESLLQKNPQKRLTIDEVLKHSFINCY